MNSLNTSLKSLEAFYGEISLVIEHLDYSKRLKARINTIANWSSMDHIDKTIINNFYKLDGLPFRTIYNSLFVSGIAGFEGFIRNLISNVLKEIEKIGNPTTALLNRHLQLSGVILSNIHSPPSHLSIDFYKVGRNISTCHPESQKFTFNSEVSHFVKKVLELENVLSILKDCGILITWDDFGSYIKLRQIVNTSGKRETGKELKKRLGSYITIRNRIAHTGISSSDITSTEISEMMDVLLAVSEFFVESCNKKLNN